MCITDHILGKQPYESECWKGIPTQVRRQLLKNHTARDSKTIIRQSQEALQPPPANMETTDRKIVATILGCPTTNRTHGKAP